ncbi:flagellin modification protein, PseA [Candidatus Falkowbacteria bacterium RIFCSPLOWO2_02_FULL_45_15]|uniref:Flagellin modification protein, PseA n=2 Tax=Candidatus Falkowiibacteriota TaxID=1752728 RepID=A0A1F5RJH8_9BACT|nr:MAG: flagellin modification protein, PseA [Candidatus Falkowbacteria bacterium RIFCSPHIGHO2_02_FULL_45_15]OGF19583.1 MAG: flagellin modification protein, PseA [Candidatus Falkowbacteria bacterium RIFCSPLOWO2_02_FULL_45_15]
MNFQYCAKCVMPNTKPDLYFDEQGVCDACRSAESKREGIDWGVRKKEFEEIIEKYKSKSNAGYDCLIPVSGGKDSTYQVHVMKDVYGFKPLCVCFEPTIPTELGRKNLDNLSKMGADVILFKKNHRVYKKMVIESLQRVGDNEWPNHVGIFTVPVHFAVKFNIPLIVWAENSELEFGGPEEAKKSKVLNRRWLEEFGGLLGNRVEDMLMQGITKRDLEMYFYPTDADLERVGVTGLFLGYFFKWRIREQLAVVQKLGFSVKEDGPMETTYTNFENLDCYSMSIHDYLKWVKYGFGRATDHACSDIRNGVITREEGVRLVRKYDGKIPSIALQKFLEYTGMDKKEFLSIVDKFANPIIFERNKDGSLKRDIDDNLVMPEQFLVH